MRHVQQQGQQHMAWERIMIQKVTPAPASSMGRRNSHVPCESLELCFESFSFSKQSSRLSHGTWLLRLPIDEAGAGVTFWIMMRSQAMCCCPCCCTCLMCQLANEVSGAHT